MTMYLHLKVIPNLSLLITFTNIFKAQFEKWSFQVSVEHSSNINICLTSTSASVST